MSIFVYCDVAVCEKRVLTRKEHQSLIRKLERGEVESTMRSLKNYKLDDSLEETLVAKQILESLCDGSRIGRIVEWTIRFMNNQENKKIQPKQFLIEQVIVEERKPIRCAQKAVSLGLEFRRYQICQKILCDLRAYQIEKEFEQMCMNLEESTLSTSMMNVKHKSSTEKFDVFCDRSDFVFDLDL